MDLSKVAERTALKPQREPHWQRLSPGRFLGYRPSLRDGAGTWIARVYDEGKRQYRLQSLGGFGELPPKERFQAAKAAAEAFAQLVERGGTARPATVKDAAERYAKINAEAEGRFKRHLYGDPLAGAQLAKLKRSHIEDWRKRLADKPASVARRKGGVTVTRPRSPASLNRDMNMLRAALNAAWRAGDISTDLPWRETLRAVPAASRRRTLYLDRQQRRALLANCDKDALPFVTALCLLPLRPGALASLTVADFDKRTSELTVGTDKAGQDRRLLLPPVAADLLKQASKDKLPAALLFARPGGEAWGRDSWKVPIANAAAAAGLPADTCAYALRHSTITDLVTGGLDLMTVAQVSGTSVEMIQRHYAHLQKEGAAKALAGLAL